MEVLAEQASVVPAERHYAGQLQSFANEYGLSAILLTRRHISVRPAGTKTTEPIADRCGTLVAPSSRFPLPDPLMR